MLGFGPEYWLLTGSEEHQWRFSPRLPTVPELISPVVWLSSEWVPQRRGAQGTGGADGTPGATRTKKDGLEERVGLGSGKDRTREPQRDGYCSEDHGLTTGGGVSWRYSWQVELSLVTMDHCGKFWNGGQGRIFGRLTWKQRVWNGETLQDPLGTVVVGFLCQFGLAAECRYSIKHWHCSAGIL